MSPLPSCGIFTQNSEGEKKVGYVWILNWMMMGMEMEYLHFWFGNLTLLKKGYNRQTESIPYFLCIQKITKVTLMQKTQEIGIEKRLEVLLIYKII